MRRYVPNPKHEQPWMGGRRGTRLDLSVPEATRLLNDPVNCLAVPGQKQLVGVRDGKIYVFQEDGTGGYHGYPATGNEVFVKYPGVARRIADLLGTDVKRLSRMHE